MKTLKQITIAAIMLTFISNAMATGTFTTFSMSLSDGTVTEVMVKEEPLVEEHINIAKYEFDLNNFPAYVEPLVEETLPTAESVEVSEVFNYLGALVSQIQKPEELVEEKEIDTAAIFAEIQRENQYVLTQQDFMKSHKQEKELPEEPYQWFTYTSLSVK